MWSIPSQVKLAQMCSAAVAAAAQAVEVSRALGLALAAESQYTYFVPDAALHYRTQPNARFAGRSKNGESDYEYVRNSLGFRDEEHAFARSEGEDVDAIRSSSSRGPQ
jgi:hypothetical protein